jgi:hypothetical protein
LLLCLSLLGAIILLAVATAAIWGAVLGAMHISGA